MEVFINMKYSASINRKIRRLYRLSQKYAMAQLKHPGLSPAELQIVRHIGFHGEVSQRHLSEDMNVDKAMVSRILQKLEKMGYLVRKEDENDARSKTVIALPPAKEIHLQNREMAENFYDQLTEDIPEEELALFERLLEQMVEKAKYLKEKQEGSPA